MAASFLEGKNPIKAITQILVFYFKEKYLRGIFFVIGVPMVKDSVYFAKLIRNQ